MTLEEEEEQQKIGEIEGDTIQSSHDNDSNSGPIHQQIYQPNSINSLPLCIVTDDILSRLPAESLIKCRRVCRQWNSSICDPSFMNRHMNRPPTRLSFIPQEIESDNIKLYDYRDGITRLVDCSYKINRFIYARSSFVYLSNFVNGLTCIDDLCGDTPYLFNPFTRQLAALPRSNITRTCTSLGFDVSTGKYKVLRQSADPNWYGIDCEVLTIGTREWRYVGRIPCIGRLGDPVFVHGAFHWKLDSMCIYSFQIGEEKFVTVKGPETSLKVTSPVYLCDLGGRLSVICYHHWSGCRRLAIWTMKVYETHEWMFLCNIDMSSILHSKSMGSVLGLENDKIVFSTVLRRTTGLRYPGQTIFTYDIHSKRFNMVCNHEDLDSPMILVRSDSLLSPRKLIGNDNDL